MGFFKSYSSPLVFWYTTALKTNFNLHIKDYKWGRKWIFSIVQAVMEVLRKYHYGNFHLQIGQNPITIAEHSGLKHHLVFLFAGINENWQSIMIRRIDSFEGFDAYGFFTLGRPHLTSVAANFITFIIVLIQFKMAEDPKPDQL